MAWDTRNGLRVRRKSSSPLVTGSVSRNSKRPKKNNTVAVAPTAQRQVISAKVSNGRRKAARKPSAVGEMGMCRQGYRGFVQRYSETPQRDRLVGILRLRGCCAFRAATIPLRMTGTERFT